MLSPSLGYLILSCWLTAQPPQDSALLRPGRIDRILYVGPPSLESRKSIFQIRLKKMAVEPGVSADELAALVRLSHPLSCAHLIELRLTSLLLPKTDGCSGAEIVQVCQDAALLAMNADLNAPFVRPPRTLLFAQTPLTPLLSHSSSLQVRKSDFLAVVATVRRRITPDMIRFFEEWRDHGSGVRSA